MTKELEFDFDVNVINAIIKHMPAFKNFCQRYPNDADLGAKLREITTDVTQVKESIATKIIAMQFDLINALFVDSIRNPKRKKRWFLF